MAKKKPQKRAPRRKQTDRVESSELSLEEILSEYRTQQPRETEPAAPEDITAPTASDADAPAEVAETVIGIPGGNAEQGHDPDPGLSGAAAAPAADEGDTERETPAERTPREADPVPSGTAREPDLPAEQGPRTPDPARRSSVPLSEIEGEAEEDDFYSGPVTEQERPSPQAEEPADAEEEEGGPEGSEEEETAKERSFFRRKTPGASATGVRPVRRNAGGLFGRLTGLAAAASLRSEQRRNQPPPEPEDPGTEMEPRKAARHYAGQMPSIRLRAMIAGGVCLLLMWITLSYGFGWPLPGGLEEKGVAAALVCLAGQITIMLLGLDIVTSGVMSVLRARPGAESLIILAGLAALIETAVCAAAGNTSRGLPFTVLSSAAVVFALWGAWFNGRGYYDSFMTCFHIKEPVVVSARMLPDEDGTGLFSSKRSSAGFIRTSEEPGPAESLAGSLFLPMTGASLALSLILSFGSGDPGAFFHVFSLMTGLCAAFGWLYSYPLLFACTARHLLYNGIAVAGWSGARQIGQSRRLVLTDTDIFPPDTVEITGIRVLNKSDVGRVISATGSMLTKAGTGTAAVFAELMRQQDAPMQDVEDFAVGEGGARGTVDSAEIRVGTSGFMHLSGVKIPDRLKERNALYTAIDGELSGVFLLRYRPTAGVQRALYLLRRKHRQPLFAVRDFNIDPLMLQREFDVSVEGFRFPTFPERYNIDLSPENETELPAGILGQEGLEPLADLYESGIQLYRFGRVCALACPVSAALGALLALVPCWTGNWAAVSSARMLLYMLACLVPGIVCRVLTRK